MISSELNIQKGFSDEALFKGVHIAIIHATRIPPHIGIIADNHYHSLTIKGQEINQSVTALIKNTRIRKIPSLFLKVKPHSTFSNEYLKEHFITNVQQFPIVNIGIATCLSPVKLFFEEVYNVPLNDVNFIYELIPRLIEQGLIESAGGLFIDEENYQLPVYSAEEVNGCIEQVRTEFKIA